MIAIIDYGMGNLRSVQKAFEKMGATAVITQDPQDISKAAKVVLPGVGAIKPAVEKLTSLKLVEAIKQAIEQKTPFLGICLGYQLLFEKSDEGGDVKALGIFPGSVDKFIFNDPALKVPHMGWNQLTIQKNDCPIFKGIPQQTNVYFCHSYFVNPKNKDIVATTTDYGKNFASSIWKDNVFAVQFHPEKSQSVGLQIIKNFIEL